MGVLFSCPVEDDMAAEGGLPAPAGSSGNAGEPTVLKASLGSGKLRIEGSLSFKREQQSPSALLQVETKISITSPRAAATAPVPMPRELVRTRFADAAASTTPPESPKHESAAVTVQKVYKSFRTRRRLADCAVLVEQSWWELLDFALLKRSSVSFFDIEKQESAVSKWSRARTRAAKVGKGLSKDENAQKLALQHWLEAIDPRHRYGHNLHYYYDCWLQCESKEPFFYWLDVGEGKEINLEDRCPRSKLLSQCIKYLGPKEREDYEVVIEDGRFMYKNSRQILDTSGGPRDAKWIFVLSTSKILYVGQKKKGTFQHSSFLAGGATSAAGRLVVEDGILKAIWPHSGHYRPTEENFQEFQSFLKDNNVDLTDVKMSPDEEDAEFWSRLKSIPSDLHAAANKPEDHDTVAAQENGHCQAPQPTEATAPEEASQHEQTSNNLTPFATIIRQASSEDAAENAEPSTTCDGATLSEDHQEENNNDHDQSAVPREKILQRISSKEAKSYQLGKQVSFKWTTGAGPRIVCVRDYPSELQLRALERVHLSPRSGGRAASSRIASPQRASSPMARGYCEPFTPPREAFRTHLQQGLLIR
ncbi:IQ domain-containing protein IQM2-like isoform X2 [Phragmites australis]|uniref:IQ domain-containing protein IQM2-like isoform X2 n=1 Tax=Phragmites australis TaxID=29695 RepID=UPI002D791D76|nr:IQ domain-containing protein IQM2-like isoform X2 [Phragmites australis]